MRERLEARLAELDADIEKGRTRLAELEVKQASLQEVFLRMLGAKQVLEELLSEASSEDGDRSDATVRSVRA